MPSIQTYYVSTGRKCAMYTLRMHRQVTGIDGTPLAYYIPPVDVYLCNLAATAELANEKARAYFDAIAARVEQSDNFRLEFGGADFAIRERIGKLSARDSDSLRAIESGVFPFGKHARTPLDQAPAPYILYWADQGAKPDNQDNYVIQALSAACMGLALETGLIAARQEKRDAQAAIDALSNHIGALGERREFTGTLYACFPKFEYVGQPEPAYYINKMRQGDDIVVYIGKALGEVGATITMRATIKRHETYNGVKTTQVNRPA